MSESTDASRMGMNRTGLQMSPAMSREMTESVDDAMADVRGIELAETRREYILEADELGSVPPPATVKGVLKTGASMLTGVHLHVLVDKLAERLAFERGGVRLYDAVIAKVKVYGDEAGNATLMELERIRDEELEHAMLVEDALKTLGADPTAQTPCADLVGVESAGLLQAATDPRTNLVQTLHTALAAELIDGAGWQLLIELAQEAGQSDLVDQFSGALAQETEHLQLIETWYRELSIPTESDA
jgi:bacterioferritin (cytochrome b1)